MKIIENGKIREMTAEEIEQHEQEQEFAKSLLTETAKDYVEEFIDGLAEVNSITDIIKLAKKFKARRNNDNS